MVLNKNITKGILPLLAIVFVGLIGCKKTPREPSRIYVAPVYPEEFSSVPCYSVFSQTGGYLFKSRMTLEARSGSVSSWPMLSAYDSLSATTYKTSSGLIAISIANAYIKSDSLTFYFKYVDWSKKLKYELKYENNIVSPQPMSLNQCFAMGQGSFTRIGYTNPYKFDLEMYSGSVYLGIDAATGKKEIVLCSCNGKIFDFGFEYGAVYTGRFTLNK
jgi:hypothetical protein